MRNRPGKIKAAPLSGLRNALLAVTLRPHMINLDRDGDSDGSKVLPVTNEKGGKATKTFDHNKVSKAKLDQLRTWETFERFEKKVSYAFPDIVV